MTRSELTAQYKKAQDTVLSSAHTLWLAGLGAASLVEERSSKLFDELVDRGHDYDRRARREFDKLKSRLSDMKTSANEARSSAASTLDELQGEIDQRLEKLVDRLGVPHRKQIQVLADRVEALTRQVEAIQREAGIEPVVAERSLFGVEPGDDGWRVTVGDPGEVASTHPTKDAALAAARQAAQAAEPSTLVVHRLDGTVQSRYHYGE